MIFCPQLYQRIVIGSDGKVMMCSNDEDGEVIIGNATTQPFTKFGIAKNSTNFANSILQVTLKKFLRAKMLLSKN